MTSSHTTDSMVITRALEWVVELEDQGMDPLSPYPTMDAKLQAFAQWFLESAQHQDAFIEAMAIAGVSRRFDVQRRIDLEHLKSAPVSNVVQFRGEAAAHRERERNPSPPRKRLLVAVCAPVLLLLAISLVISSLRSSPQVYSYPVRYSAGIGERRFVPLEDGSTIDLNTRSTVEVDITPHARRVTLLAGEAVFSVRHDAIRPFSVLSGGLVIRDVGTKFAVRLSSAATTVSVLEGRVAISAAEAGKGNVPPAIVDADHQVAITVSGTHFEVHVAAVTAADLARELAWRDGHLVLHGETLGQIVTEFNRYNRRQIEIADPSIARVMVGGTFTTTDFDAFVATLGVVFHLRTVPAPDNANDLELERQENQ